MGRHGIPRKCLKGFVNKFLRVLLALLGHHGNCSIGSIYSATLRKMFTKPFTQPAAPRCIDFEKAQVMVRIGCRLVPNMLASSESETKTRKALLATF